MATHKRAVEDEDELVEVIPDDEKTTAEITSTSRQGWRLVPPTELQRIEMGPAAFDQVLALAAAKGKSVSAFLRDAVALQVWFDEALKDGGRITVRRKGRKPEEITAR